VRGLEQRDAGLVVGRVDYETVDRTVRHVRPHLAQVTEAQLISGAFDLRWDRGGAELGEAGVSCSLLGPGESDQPGGVVAERLQRLRGAVCVTGELTKMVGRGRRAG